MSQKSNESYSPGVIISPAVDPMGLAWMEGKVSASEWFAKVRRETGAIVPEAQDLTQPGEADSSEDVR